MAGASLWVIYGILMQASPVVAANLLVLLAAAWTAARPPAVGGARAPQRQSSGAHD